MKIYKTEYDSHADFIKTGNRCGTPDPAEVMLNRVERNRASFRETNESFRSVSQLIVIPIRFIHVLDGSEGEVTHEQRTQQIEVLNAAYQSAGIAFHFEESEVVQVKNSAWFQAGPETEAEQDMKKSLVEHSTRQLNFITSSADGLLGWATFPWELPLRPKMDGVVVLYDSLPGGAAAPFNLGQTATHEVAHWLGLLHTFQGGCNPIGDNVADTVAHATPNFHTPDPNARNGACNPDQKAPVNNYMNYVDDSHMTEFTELQILRMRDLIGIFRPGLIETEVNQELQESFQPFTPFQ